MKITQVHAIPLKVAVEVDLVGLRLEPSMAVCLVEVHTDEGLIGHGMTAITDERVVASAIDEVLAPQLLGLDPLRHEQVWERMYWLLSPRGQTGFASHAMSAIDTALWDIKGKALGQPVWRLLGGARSRVQVYTTFGFPAFDRERLAEAARHWLALGHRRLKMVVGHQALQRRDEAQTLMDVIREDAARVRAVRQAVGDGVELYIDANCSLDLAHATQLCRMIDDCGISFFEEPITQNDAAQMADLRRRTGVSIAAGQNEGLMHRFRDLLLAGAVDYLQPNAVISGGFTQAAKIAALANAFNLPVVNGGAWPYHNMHLQAGVSNGTMVEYHYFSALVCQRLFRNLPQPVDGWLELPQAPGLGFEPDAQAIAELVEYNRAPRKPHSA